MRISFLLVAVLIASVAHGQVSQDEAYARLQERKKAAQVASTQPASISQVEALNLRIRVLTEEIEKLRAKNKELEARLAHRKLAIGMTLEEVKAITNNAEFSITLTDTGGTTYEFYVGTVLNVVDDSRLSGSNAVRCRFVDGKLESFQKTDVNRGGGQSAQDYAAGGIGRGR